MHLGLGPIPHDRGVAFGVWAPHAEAVCVVGTFNEWDAEANPLERDDSGCWSCDVPAAKVGDEYRYGITYGGTFFTRIDPRARALTDSKGNGLVHDPRFDWEGDDFTPASLEQFVLYELHAGTFNADDGPGTLATAAARLDHLRRLGVNGVTLMPITEFVGETGWGYDLAHLYAVESSYGGPTALKEFVKAAHRGGIAVLLDVVYNHLGNVDNLLWRFDGWHEGRFGGIYFFQDEVRADTPWGPRPDFGRREVRDYVLDNVLMWLGEYRVDGLRVDGTFHMRTASRTERGEGGPLPEGWSLLQEITDTVRTRYPKAILVAEDMRGDPSLTWPTAQGGAGFHCQWSDGFAHTARASTAPGNLPGLTMAVLDGLLIRYNEDPFQRILFAESHDNAGKEGRIPAVADPDDPESPTARRRAALAAAIVFTAPGVPQLFQGQELLDPRSFDLKNPHPLDLGRAERFGGLLRFHQELIALRKNSISTTAGLAGPHVNAFHFDKTRGLLAWHRWKAGGPGDDVIVVANLSGEPRGDVEIGAPRPGVWRVRLDSETERYRIGTGRTQCPDPAASEEECDALPYRIRVSVGPFGVLVLSQDA